MARRGGKKVRKQKESKQARADALSQLCSNSSQNYGYSSCVFLCGCQIIEHRDNFRGPFDRDAISSWPINRSDVPRSMTEGCHFDNEFFYVDTVDDVRCPMCRMDREESIDLNTTSWSSSTDKPMDRYQTRTWSRFRFSPNYNIVYHPEYSKAYRRPIVRSTTRYLCGHSRRECDWQYHGYQPFEDPRSTYTPFDCKRPRPGDLISGIHLDAEMTFEYSDHTNLCTECFAFIVDHLLDCLECAEQFMWTVVEAASSEGRPGWCDIGIDGTKLSRPRLGFAFEDI